jgi:flagellin-like protein
MQIHDRAVSPVIAVMLMLVVTIIIAAVVSGFAGGLVGTQQKTPQATIKVEYSQSRGMTISHTGGDPLTTSDIYVMLRPSRMIENADAWVSEVNRSLIQDENGNPWWVADTSKTTRSSAFKPGDLHRITAANCSPEFLQPQLYNYMTGPTRLSDTKAITAADNIGKLFYLDFYEKSGKMITQSEVTITP